MPTWLLPLWLKAARIAIKRDEPLGQKLYAKIFQRMKRIAMIHAATQRQRRAALPMAASEAVKG